jgi:mannose-6-phosphate isomerase
MRLRVQARQVFVFSRAGQLGWGGASQQAVRHGIDAIFSHYRHDNGLFRSAPSAPGSGQDDVDLYDQAFVLLALAAGRQAGVAGEELTEQARQLLSALEAHLAHPEGGFREYGADRSLRSNPHMHLLEALLEWVVLEPDGQFRAKADEITALAIDRLIDPVTGAIGEVYDSRWRPAPGRAGDLREPGHQFEWAFLLSEAGQLLDRDLREPVERLYDFGTRFGLADGRVISAVDARGSPVDTASRLWQQTERLRASIALAGAIPGVEPAHHRESLAGFQRFLLSGAPAYWHDRLSSDGAPIAEASSASSLYHIITGFEHVLRGH